MTTATFWADMDRLHKNHFTNEAERDLVNGGVPAAVAAAFLDIKAAASPANIRELQRFKDWTARRLLAHALFLHWSDVEEASDLYELVGDHIREHLEGGGSVFPEIAALHFALNQFCVAHKARGWIVDIEPEGQEDD